MYEICKRLQISASHRLTLPYESKCSNLHGHNWDIAIYASAGELNAQGMVYDFAVLKKRITDELDHKDITELIRLDGKCVNPTAEHIARYIAEKVGPTCDRVEVRESEGNTAIWRADR